VSGLGNRDVWVVGIGLHPYQKPSDTPYPQLGVTAIREALADAGLDWKQVETAYTGTATTSMALSRIMYRHLGATGIPMLQVENASASGSTAFRQACIDVAAGIHDVAIAVGVDKPLNLTSPQRAAGLDDLVGNRVLPVTHFALLASRYMHATGASAEQIAAVAVKNSRNAALNPYAQRPQARLPKPPLWRSNRPGLPLPRSMWWSYTTHSPWRNCSTSKRWGCVKRARPRRRWPLVSST
jgi:acetyl-CoA acetyltransferase